MAVTEKGVCEHKGKTTSVLSCPRALQIIHALEVRLRRTEPGDVQRDPHREVLLGPSREPYTYEYMNAAQAGRTAGRAAAAPPEGDGRGGEGLKEARSAVKNSAREAQRCGTPPGGPARPGASRSM